MRRGLAQRAALWAIAAMGLTATRAAPPPTPPAGFYRVESEGGPVERVQAICFARGHGYVAFGEGAGILDPNQSCGDVSVRANGDGWVSRQRCQVRGAVVDFTTEGVRLGPGEWRVRSSLRYLSSHLRPSVAVVRRLSRLANACPQGWRPGDYLELTPHQAGRPWPVRNLSGPRPRAPSYVSLPPRLADLLR
jgi:hypothetical protein